MDTIATIMTCLEKEQYAAALELILENEITLADNVDFMKAKAFLAIQTGEYRTGIHILNQAKNLEPNDSEIYYYLTCAYENLENTYIEEKNLCETHEKMETLLNKANDKENSVIGECILEGKTNENTTDDKIIEALTSIIILTHNQLDYTKLCIDSIRQYTTAEHYEIIVIDNASTDTTVEWLGAQKDIKCIFNKENLGFPKGCNQGIEIATGTEILLLNNDTIVTTNWLTNLKMALYSDEKIGAVGPVTNNCSNYQAIAVPYKDVKELGEFATKYNAVSNPNKWENRLKLVGFCLLVKRTIVNLIGVLDERFTPGNFEDDDYSFRIIESGHELLLCNDTFIHHFGSVSFKEKPIEYNNLLQLNADKFQEKWGFNAQYSTFCRHEIIQFIDIKKDDLKILEVGCACGATLLKLKYLNRTTQIYGIELSKGSAAIAKQFANVTAQNIENPVMDYEKGMFDYVIFADVLEHLYHPDRVLSNIKKYLKPDGYILASIPNVQHISVVKNLLQGNWTYENAGILDRTHIRFFTFKEIEKLFRQGDYVNMQYGAVNIGTTAEDSKIIDMLSNVNLVENKESLSIYQYLIKAQNNGQKSNALEHVGDISLSFLLRRIENDIELEKNTASVIDLINNARYTIIDIADKIKIDIYQKAKTGIEIAAALYKNNRQNDAVQLLTLLYKTYQNDADIVYGLAFILHLMGDDNRALNLLDNFPVKNDNIQSLLKELREGAKHE